MVEVGGIGKGGQATAGEDMDGAMADCGGRGEKRVEAWRQRRWRRPRYDMNKILNWGVFLGVLVTTPTPPVRRHQQIPALGRDP
jgi:hypothetical protein